jgi:hypothetical protein
MREAMRCWMAAGLLGWASLTPTTSLAEAAWGTTRSAPAGTLAQMFGVEVIAPDDVWAVGAYNPGEPPTAVLTRPYAQHWDGSAWTQTPVPLDKRFESQSSRLAGVSGVAGNDVWAVGHVDDISSLAARTLAYRWDGSAWIRVPTPNPSPPELGDRLNAVTSVSPTDAWAVGSSGGVPGHSLVLRWDGAQWLQQEAPDIGELSAVVHDGKGVWAAGIRRVMRFVEGRGWRVLPALPVPPPDGGLQLSGLAHGAGRLWAVGTIAREVGEWIFFTGFAAYWSDDSGAPGWTHVPTAGQVTWLTGVTAIGQKVWASSFEGRVLRLTPQDAVREVTPVQETVSLNAINADPSGNRWAVGLQYVDSSWQPALLDAPAIGQGGIRVHTGHSGAIVTWIGPQDGSGETDPFGNFSTGGLPVGRYQIVASGQGSCTPGLAKVRVEEGKVREVTALIEC